MLGEGRCVASISARGLSQVRQTFEGVCLHSPEVRGFPTELQPAFDRSDAGRLNKSGLQVHLGISIFIPRRVGTTHGGWCRWRGRNAIGLPLTTHIAESTSAHRGLPGLVDLHDHLQRVFWVLCRASHQSYVVNRAVEVVAVLRD